MKSVGSVKSSFFVRKEIDHTAAFTIDRYPLKNSAILDSGTTIHIFNEISRFTNFRTADPRDFVCVKQKQKTFSVKVQPNVSTKWKYVQSQQVYFFRRTGALELSPTLFLLGSSVGTGAVELSSTSFCSSATDSKSLFCEVMLG